MKISVVAHPNSKKPRLEKDLSGTLHIYVNTPPLEGKANEAVIDALAKHFNVKKRNIIIVTGHKSKYKSFEIFQPIPLG